jgi:hypothetical protein
VTTHIRVNNTPHDLSLDSRLMMLDALRDVDVVFVGEPDSMTPLGTKSVGEVPITGMAAANRECGL